MRRILFICYGNICRSPMAEFILKDLVMKRGLESGFAVASRGTGDEALGYPVYRHAAAELQKHGIGCAGKTAELLRAEDYQRYDLLIAMDSMNVRSILRITGGDPDGKVHRLLEYADQNGDVDDPWYTRRFDIAYREILRGCEGLLKRLIVE